MSAQLIRIFTSTLVVLAALGSTAVYSLDSHANGSTGSKPRKLLLAVDGLSYEAFAAARKQGLFKSFNQFGRHISPYPSMTEVSWTELMGGRELFPLQGNAKSVEAKSFDVDTLTLVDDPRLIFNRYANPYNFTRAFDYLFNPVMEGLMYFPNQSIINMEFEELEKEIYAGFKGDHYIAYVSSVDAIAHTQKDALYPLLKKLDLLINRIEKHYEGQDVEIAVISDHGNVGGFSEGEPEQYLTEISAEELIGKSGLRIVEGQLKSPDEIAMPILALGNYANVFFKDLSRRRVFADAALQSPAVDLVTYVEAGRTIILGRDSQEAELSMQGSLYLYRPIRGNPLRLEAQVLNRLVTDREMLMASLKTRYPDAAYRLMQVQSKQVATEGDLILNLRDGYCFGGSFSKIVRMVRTHGSLSSASTFGVVASTRRKIPSHLRSKEFLRWFGVSPAQTFHKQEDFFHRDPLLALEKAKAGVRQGIATRIDDLSPDMIFLRINKIIAGTLDVLTPKDFSDLLSVFNTRSAAGASDAKAGLEAQAKYAAETLGQIQLQDIIANIDRLVALKDFQSDEKDPSKVAAAAKSQIFDMPGFSPLKTMEEQLTSSLPGSAEFSQTQIAGVADGVRRLVMKLYTMPFLINESLNLPEMEHVPDSRDLQFAEQWHRVQKPALLSLQKNWVESPKDAQKLFQSIFRERELLREIAPASMPLLYNPAPQDLTVVFVPGVYNELFDKEIFSKGLRALRDQLGLRVLYADVDGRCSSGINAREILRQLKEDTQRRLERGYREPRYLILGYSKGGVDSTEALLLDEAFTHRHVLGLVSIASPHLGTSIIETADLPNAVLDRVVIRPIPAECRTDSATSSLNRAARENFWAKNINQLAGLTRYFSMTFEIDAKSAHPWMKLTKAIGRFRTPNDGVVTTASSRFPEELHALDLGTVHADHLAGILASGFPQEAFMESLLLSLFEMKAFESTIARRWYEEVASRSQSLLIDYRKRHLSRITMQALLSSGAESLVQAVGPFPDATGLESEDWYGVISQEKELLKAPLKCESAHSLREMKRVSRALKELLLKSEYPARSLELSCDNGQIHLRLQTGKRPWLKLWEKRPSEQRIVSTLGDLIEALLEKGMKSGENLLELNSVKLDAIPMSSRSGLPLPESTLKWTADSLIDLRKFPQMMALHRVQPLLDSAHRDAVRIVFDHQHAEEFRREYGFSYESTSPGAVDDNLENGYAPKIDVALDSSGGSAASVLRMKTKNSSIRMTTPYYRFKPAEFPKMSLKVKILQDVPGADSSKGGSGKDDSAFQIWFTMRNVRNVTDRSQFQLGGDAKILGYYWGEKDQRGKSPKAGSLVENYYSNKNFVVAVLPEAWQYVIASGEESIGKWLDFKADLSSDFSRAFPKENVADWEIVSITIQTDSNDTRQQSEAYFKEVSFSR